MRSTIILTGLVSLVIANPAPQAIDFAAVQAAPPPAYTQPPVTAVSQSIVYNSASISAEASAAVTGVASASATASIAARALHEKRSVHCLLWFCWGTPSPSSSSSSSTKSSTSCTTSTSTSSAIAVTTSSTTSSAVYSTVSSTSPSSAVITTSAISSAAPSITSTTPTISYPSSVYTSESGCPTPFEIGTYCGFINPEDPCALQPDGYGPQVTPDTVAAFESYPAFSQSALTAQTPAGYVETFQNLNASASANSYLGLHTLQAYDVIGCSQWCDNTTLCTAFNVYIERDPSLNPTATYCPNPSSITNYKCTLWGSGVDAASATNFGDYRGDFQVVIAGSNGYEKTNNTTPATPPGWTNPQSCGGNSHSHPQTCIGQKFFPGPYDPSICGAYATAQNSANAAKASSWFWKLINYNPYTCNFFNAYMLKKNGVAQGTYCSLFAEQYDKSKATYTPGWVNNVFWNVESSWTFCSA